MREALLIVVEKFRRRARSDELSNASRAHRERIKSASRVQRANARSTTTRIESSRPEGCFMSTGVLEVISLRLGDSRASACTKSKATSADVWLQDARPDPDVVMHVGGARVDVARVRRRDRAPPRRSARTARRGEAAPRSARGIPRHRSHAEARALASEAPRATDRRARESRSGPRSRGRHRYLA